MLFGYLGSRRVLDSELLTRFTRFQRSGSGELGFEGYRFKACSSLTLKGLGFDVCGVFTAQDLELT